MKLPGVLREVNLFVAVGLAATCCHAGVALAVHAGLGLGPMTATLAGYVASVGVSYFGNSLLTFRRRALVAPQFARFAAISLAGLAVNQSIVFVASRLLVWPLALALVPVVVVVPASTFLMSKFWAFRPLRAEPFPRPASPGQE